VNQSTIKALDEELSMKIMAAVLVSLTLFGAMCIAQTSSSADSGKDSRQALTTSDAAQPKTSPAKEADIRKLFDVTGTKATMMQVMDSMENNIRPTMTNMFPPGEYRDHLIDLFFEKFHSKADPEQMIELAIPVYDKYLSDEDVRELIQFYATPLGQKTITILPKIVIECSQAGEKWGEKLGRESMREVLTEHPDLQKALEEASKNAQQH
jgi:hypothetical protein